MWFILLWQEKKRRGPLHIPAPKIPLPGHAASYRPPDEYLFTEEEAKKWEEQDPEERQHDFIPKKHNSLLEVNPKLIIYFYFGDCTERFVFLGQTRSPIFTFSLAFVVCLPCFFMKSLFNVSFTEGYL